jgi:aminopeptidase-like protein
VAIFLARELSRRPARRFSYRILFAPGTIGAIAWLAENEERLAQIRHGLVLALLGDPGEFTYKSSRRGNAEIDRVAQYVLGSRTPSFRLREYDPYGYDERQYGSLGIDLPMGRLTRSPHGEYDEYHTSADNLDLVAPSRLSESLDVCLGILDSLEQNRTYLNLEPRCEPQLGRRGLYDLSVEGFDAERTRQASLWLLSFCDGQTPLLKIASRSRLPLVLLHRVARLLIKHDLLREIGPGGRGELGDA